MKTKEIGIARQEGKLRVFTDKDDYLLIQSENSMLQTIDEAFSILYSFEESVSYLGKIIS
jgi:hypothetical protein